MGKTTTAVVMAVYWLLPPGAAMAATETQSLAVDLTAAGASQYNIDHTERGIRLSPQAREDAGEGTEHQGFYVTAALGTQTPMRHVRPIMLARTPPGSDVMLELRGQTASSRWTEWREAVPESPEVVLPASAVRLQARITLVQRGPGQGPEVLGLRLQAPDPHPPHDEARTGPPAQKGEPVTPPVTTRVFATRIGQIGDRTANGHRIGSADRFVALPSRRALNANTYDRSYEVKICYPVTNRCVTAPIWDVGPWNIRDDYWNEGPVRQMWADLPKGTPQAQAAYIARYNKGRDDRSRRVRNPAGIDLADELYWEDLGMTTNDWVMVTYLWTGDDMESVK
ncbi:hypothetical protein [Nonomuraea typhae]|uniref:DNRLRE domain-containing protein n=1 Tax=Nonomuraea typhae TaxID=2603600 RepID=A0ABW7YUB5_9ACTN